MKPYYILIVIPVSVIMILMAMPSSQEFRCRDCNVVFITIDTLRADHVSSYGYPEPTTPYLDSLSAQGISFANAYSQIPHTPPSHWSMFTGLYPFRHQQYLPTSNGSGLETLPEILEANGYVTSAVISSQMVKGFNHKFGYFNDHNDSLRETMPISRTADKTTEIATGWLDKHKDRKFFLWVHYFDPHNTYDPPEDFDIFNYSESSLYVDEVFGMEGLTRRKTIRQDIAKYDGEISFVDYNIERLINDLKGTGIYNRTLIIIMSDHGECFGDHMFSDFGYPDEGPCIFHGTTLFDEEIHVPLIIVNPYYPVKGVSMTQLVESVDIFPTVLETLGIAHGGGDGESLVPLIETGRRVKDYVMIQTRKKDEVPTAFGIRTDEWKFVRMMPSEIDIDSEIREQAGESVNFEDEASLNAKRLLFDMRGGEKINFIDENPQIAEELETRILNAAVADHETTTDDETLRILRSFGYFG
jgi:arylsulfatase A-like enzyme